jgi:CBS domain containing-hemolysin-like protein
MNSGTSFSFATLGATAMGFAVAAFLWFGASQALRVAAVAQRSQSLRVDRLLRPAVYLPASTPISEALRRLAAARAAAIVVIDSEGRSRALVQEAQISAMEPNRRPWSTLAEVSRPLEPGLIIDDSLSGEDLLAAVRTTPASEYLVIGRDGTSRGLIATADVARALGLPEGESKR